MQTSAKMLEAGRRSERHAGPAPYLRASLAWLGQAGRGNKEMKLDFASTIGLRRGGSAKVDTRCRHDSVKRCQYGT